MPRLSDEERQKRFRKLAILWGRRAEGVLSEEQIAEELEFKDSSGTPSARVMYETLQEEWDLPNWSVKPDDVAEGTETTKERKASSGGDAKKLPAAEQAERLFRADLDRLTYYLKEIPDLKEHLQGKRFVSSSWVGEDWEEYHREEYTEHDWKRVCQDFDVDPAQEAFRVPISPYVHRGSGPMPWEGLSVLIAVHALLREDLDRLIGALHHDPASVNLEELYERKGKDGGKKDGVVTEFKRAAAKLVVTVRGGEVKSGQKVGVAPPEEISIALMVGKLTKEGLSAEAIYHQLKEWRLLDERGRYWVHLAHEDYGRKEQYTIEDVKRHQELGLSPPD